MTPKLDKDEKHMKSLAVYSFAFFLAFGFIAQADAKKRFGGGGFGKTSKPASASQQPSSFDQKKADSNSNAAGSQNNLSANNATAKQGASKKGMLGGLMGGLLAGGLIAAMLGGGFEGIQFMDILLIALVAFIIFKLIKSRRPAPVAAMAGGPGEPVSQPDNSQQQGVFRQAVQSIGGGAQSSMDLPADFDVNGFLEGALEHYRTLQAAWNEGNLDVVREYVAPTVYAQLHNERKAMKVAPQTEVLDLTAELVGAEQDQGTVNLSILFKGRCKDEVEGSEEGIFDIWHLEKDTKQENATWLIVGIETE